MPISQSKIDQIAKAIQADTTQAIETHQGECYAETEGGDEIAYKWSDGKATILAEDHEGTQDFDEEELVFEIRVVLVSRN